MKEIVFGLLIVKAVCFIAPIIIAFIILWWLAR